MAVERTFSIIKPDATARNLTGAINAMIEKAGLRIIAQKRVMISRAQAETFYAVHRQRPFFGELVDFMTSGPVVVQVLEGENAIAAYRDLMGATDPAKAAPGTIRKAFAEVDRRKFGARLRRRRDRAKRDRAVLLRQRNRRLKKFWSFRRVGVADRHVQGDAPSTRSFRDRLKSLLDGMTQPCLRRIRRLVFARNRILAFRPVLS